MTEIINQEISIGVPDGFHIMSKEELTKIYVTNDPNRWGIWDHDRHARGYSFTYTVQDIIQHVDTLLFKVNKRIYSINFIGRNENREQDHELFEEVLKNVSFLK